MTTPVRRFVVCVSVIVLAGIVAMDAVRRRSGWPEHFTALAINTETVGRTSSDIVDILVISWSIEEEKNELTAVFLDKGPGGLPSALRDMRRVGFIRTPDNLAYSLRFAWQESGDDGGRRVILAIDRPLRLWEPWWESMRWHRDLEDPFTWIEMRLNRDGEGEGKMCIATKIAVNRNLNLIELADYANEPVRLMFVRSVTSSTS